MRPFKEEELREKIERLKTVEKELITNPKQFIKANSFRCTINNGRVLVRDQIIKGNGNGSAVVILPIINGNETLLVIQPRVFTKTTVGVELPAGYVEANESPEEAAIRELREETGIQAKSVKKICGYYQDDGCSSAFINGFIAYDCQNRGHQHLDGDEIIELFSCTIDEMFELVERGIISGGGSQLIIEKAKQYIKRL